MEAAEKHVWRPLGAVLVAQGVITSEELEDALSEQVRSGRRLGEILIGRGLASPPAIVDALAEQAGQLFESEQGFGSGLRAEIVRRHRERRPPAPIELVEAEAPAETADEMLVEADEPAPEPEAVTVATPATPPPASPVPEEPPPPRGLSDDLTAAIGRARAHLTARRAALPPLA